MSIQRAETLLRKAAQAHQTGQPNLAALYERNARQAIREQLRVTRRIRIQAKSANVFVYLAQDLAGPLQMIGRAFENLGRAFQASREDDAQRKNDYTLA